MQLSRWTTITTALVLCGPAAPASAELVFLSSGRTLSIASHREVGSTVVLSLRSGGEVSCDRSLIERIEADEVPYPEPIQAAGGAQGSLPAPVLYEELINNLAATHDVDPNLVKAVIKVESGYRVKARSRKGAMGLMQIMPATARQYAVRNPYDPKANLEAGIRHLASLLGRFEVSVALAAYNAGEGAVRRFGGIPPYRETRDYVRRILALVKPASN